MTEPHELVTVTGASGFIGLHCIKKLLARGYRVRGTVRSTSKADAVRAALDLDDDASARLEFTAANLTEDDGWPSAVEGAKYVLHVASPVPIAYPKTEDEVIIPAREGTLRVLRAASESDVERVVLTSSVAAISSGHGSRNKPFDESDWSDLSGPMGTYEKSKTLAERAAWDFIEETKPGYELVAVNPAFVLGPSLMGRDNASNELVSKLLRKEVPGIPKLHISMADVRDVAEAHILAMTTPEAKGQRFVIFSDACWYGDIARTLKEGGFDVPTRGLPNWLVKIVALFDKTVKLVVPGLGREFILSNERARMVLGWKGRDMKSMVIDTARHVTERKGDLQ